MHFTHFSHKFKADALSFLLISQPGFTRKWSPIELFHLHFKELRESAERPDGGSHFVFINLPVPSMHPDEVMKNKRACWFPQSKSRFSTEPRTISDAIPDLISNQSGWLMEVKWSTNTTGVAWSYERLGKASASVSDHFVHMKWDAPARSLLSDYVTPITSQTD